MGWLALPYAAHKYLTIRPELDYYNYGDDPADQRQRRFRMDHRRLVPLRFLGRGGRRTEYPKGAGPQGPALFRRIGCPPAVAFIPADPCGRALLALSDYIGVSDTKEAAMRRFCAIVFCPGFGPGPFGALFGRLHRGKWGARINQEIGWHFIGKEHTVNGKDDLTDSFLNLPSTSYLRATFMGEDGKVGVRLETGLGDGSTITTRRAFGWYKKGDFTFLAGQTDNWQGAAGAYWPEQKTEPGPRRRQRQGLGKSLAGAQAESCKSPGSRVRWGSRPRWKTPAPCR